MLLILLMPAQSCASTVPVKAGDIIAGGGNLNGAKDVGDIYIWNDDNNLYVKYVIVDQTPGVITDNWYITETELAISTTLNDIPQANGNPIPGKFTYKNTLNYATEYTYSIPITWPKNTELLVAAHAVVGNPGGVQGFSLSLPATASVKVTAPSAGVAAYFPTVEITNGGSLNGNYQGWCIDPEGIIIPARTYTANVYSSYGSLPAGLIAHPENLDLLNYIINQNLVGTASPGGYGIYTYGDVQLAIWTLIDDEVDYTDSALNAYDVNRVNEIIAKAKSNGEGYTPKKGGKIAVILEPVSPIVGQNLIIEVPLSSISSTSETAWGAVTKYDQYGRLSGLNYPFPGKNWATYLKYKTT